MSTLKLESRECSVCAIKENSIEFQPRYSICRPCYKEKQKKWNNEYYKKNKKKIIDKEKEKYWSDPELYRSKRRKTYHKHSKKYLQDKKMYYVKNNIASAKKIRYANDEDYRKKVLSTHKKWAKTERGKDIIRRSNEKRRRSLKDIYDISEKDIKRLYRSNCIICENPKITIDHIIPISRGGRHSIGNLQPLCRSCNSSKGSKLMIQWLYKE